ncbi:uncharacterized protein LOC130015235 [Mercurialis annua]|uniref:uncharacterized protein LOC130015235 n=1 Tax=Mercurialis annua TaxID=3986 RepID=UPI0024AC930B|nr:uncharacterized protein LOC130015235 [Mercurialis annua]
MIIIQVILWKVRNAAIFDDIIPNIHQALRMVWTSIRETNYFRCGTMFNSVSELQILKILGINGIVSKAPKIIPVYWQPPPCNWIKVNTDGSALGAPGPAGAGGIFRNSDGHPVGAFAVNVGNDFANVAELFAAINAVEIAWNKNWLSLWLECDSQYVVQLFVSSAIRVPCLGCYGSSNYRRLEYLRKGGTSTANQRVSFS